MKKIFILILFIYPTWSNGQVQISTTKLQSDSKLLWQALNELHPGLYRHVDTIELVKAYDQLMQNFSKERTQAEAFEHLSEFVVKIKCGHTYLNPYNQPSDIIDSIISEPVLLPFGFRIIENKIIVNQSLIKDLHNSDIIKCINNILVKEIIDSLSLFVKADGNRKTKKIKDLELSLDNKYNYFDYYFPIIFGFRDSVSIELDNGDLHSIPLVNNLFRQTQGNNSNISYDNMWSYTFEKQYAYLKLETFVTWKMTFNWESYLDDFFNELNRRKIKHLIIDIRDNEGGLTEVADYLTHRLARQNGKLVPRRMHLAYRKVSEKIRPHVSTWSRWFYNTTLWTKKLNDKYRTPRFTKIKKKIKKNANAFQGKTFLIINESNSSATFMLAENCKINNFATLVGAETGGTKMGINGGQIFFLKLPNTKLEIDIPLIGYYPITHLTDEGIIPDIRIPTTINDIKSNIDSQLNYITNQLIKKK